MLLKLMQCFYRYVTILLILYKNVLLYNMFRYFTTVQYSTVQFIIICCTFLSSCSHWYVQPCDGIV